jgi:hypothetical protein
MAGGSTWTQVWSDRGGRYPYRLGLDWQREKERRGRDGTVAKNGLRELGFSASVPSGDNEGRCYVRIGSLGRSSTTHVEETSGRKTRRRDARVSAAERGTDAIWTEVGMGLTGGTCPSVRERISDLVVVKLGRAGKLGRNEAGGLPMLPGSEKEKGGRVGLDRLQNKKKKER